MSRLANLSHIDFEDLCRDLARAETGKEFSAFGPGPDGGIDGRHSSGQNSIILQCKHYLGSTFSQLKATLRKEMVKIEKLDLKRYIFYTSQSLSPNKHKQLAEIIGLFLKNDHDILGKEDIEASLRRNPAIEKSHIKLWLSSSAVLERVLHSGLEAFTQATREEILEELRVFVRNPSFDEAKKRLDEIGILIVSGPPGVGKTTLARMITFELLEQGWSFLAIRSLEEGFARVDDNSRTIFFFDDFLGRIELNSQALLQHESAFATFVRRIRKAKNSRFIMTTRAHIFEEACLLSDYMGDEKLQLSKYILNVDSYTRKIRSQILFNHLSVSKLTTEHIVALLEGNWLRKIVDHKNYNPRVVASVSSDSIDELEPDQYPKYVYQALEKPDLIWSKPFQNLSIKCKNLLVCLYFASGRGQEIGELRESFVDLHRSVCAFHSQPTQPEDFDHALRSLESGFVSISDTKVDFVNPSLEDFLKAYLIDINYLRLLPAGAKRADWASRLWSHVQKRFKAHPDVLASFTLLFLDYCKDIDNKPTLKESKAWRTTYSTDDLALSGRADLLLKWWEHTKEDTFINKAHEVLLSSSLRLVSWRDGRELPGLHWWVNEFVDESHVLKDRLLAAIEVQFVEALEEGLTIDELVPVVESVYGHMADTISESTREVLDSIIDYEFSSLNGAIAHLEDEESLLEQIEHIKALAEITGRDPQYAIKAINDRLAEFDDGDWSEELTNWERRTITHHEEFDDAALYSLFSSLLSSQGHLRRDDNATPG